MRPARDQANPEPGETHHEPGRQVARLLAMVPYLQARPGVPIAEVAEAFGDARQVLADLNVLWMCGLPGGLPDDLIEIDMDAVEGEGIVHLGNANYLSRPSGSPATKPSRWWSPSGGP